MKRKGEEREREGEREGEDGKERKRGKKAMVILRGRHSKHTKRGAEGAAAIGPHHAR